MSSKRNYSSKRRTNLTRSTRVFRAGFALASGSYLFFAHCPDEAGGFARSRHWSKSLRYDGPEFATQVLRYGYEKSRGHDAPGSVLPAAGGIFNIQDAAPSESDSANPFEPGSDDPFAKEPQGENPFDGEGSVDNPFGPGDAEEGRRSFLLVCCIKTEEHR